MCSLLNHSEKYQRYKVNIIGSALDLFREIWELQSEKHQRYKVMSCAYFFELFREIWEVQSDVTYSPFRELWEVQGDVMCSRLELFRELWEVQCVIYAHRNLEEACTSSCSHFALEFLIIFNFEILNNHN